MITLDVVLLQLGESQRTCHHNYVGHIGTQSEIQRVQELVLGVKSILDLNMRRAVLARKLSEHPAHEVVSVLTTIVRKGGRGDLAISATLAALVASLEPPSPVSYQTRAELYAAASQSASTEIAYILLEVEEEKQGEPEDIPRPLMPAGPPMSLGARKSAARTRDRVILTHLIHDPNLQVVEVLLDNANLVETDVLAMASQRPAHPTALRRIANHRRWSLPRRIRLAITLNPNCPLPLACRLCLDLRDSDLREITRNAASPPLLRGHAQRLLENRL